MYHPKVIARCCINLTTLSALPSWCCHHSLKWLHTFKCPEGILARSVETLAEFNFENEHRPGRLHSNVDGVSRSVCKQYLGKEAKTRWVDELEHADELTEPLGVQKNNECTKMLDVQWDDSVSDLSYDSEGLEW